MIYGLWHRSWMSIWYIFDHITISHSVWQTPHRKMQICIGAMYIPIGENYFNERSLGGTARWLQLQPSSAWPRRRKRSKMFSLCTIRITARSSWDSSESETFISRLSPCFTGVIWFPYDVIMAKEKCGLDDGCTILIFSTDDGCTCWWRWLHCFGRVIFDTHTADPLQTNMLIGCMIVVKCDTCKISGAYAHFDCITCTVGDIGNRHSMQVTQSYKERLFPPQLEINLWMIWHHKLKLPLRAKYSWFQGMVIRVEQCAKFEAISSIMHGTPQFDPFHQFKIGQEWRVERRKIPRLPGSLDHYSAPHYWDVIMGAMASQSPASWLFIQPFVQSKSKENIKASRHWSVSAPP